MDSLGDVIVLQTILSSLLLDLHQISTASTFKTRANRLFSAWTGSTAIRESLISEHPVAATVEPFTGILIQFPMSFRLFQRIAAVTASIGMVRLRECATAAMVLGIFRSSMSALWILSIHPMRQSSCEQY